MEDYISVKIPIKVLRRQLWPLLLSIPFFCLACGGGHMSTPVTPPPTSNCVTPPSGLISWWRGESNADDAKSLYNGTASANVTYAAAKVGSGFVFDGTSSVDMGVVTGTQLDAAASDFTVEFWLKTSSDTSAGLGEFVVGDGGAGQAPGYRVIYNPSNNPMHQLRFRVADTTSATLLETGAVNDGNWHHFAFVRSTTSLIAYEDGAQISGSPVTTAVTSIASLSRYELGARADLNDSFFTGDLDEVSVYNRALTAAEVSSIFAAGSDGKCH